MMCNETLVDDTIHNLPQQVGRAASKRDSESLELDVGRGERYGPKWGI